MRTSERNDARWNEYFYVKHSNTYNLSASLSEFLIKHNLKDPDLQLVGKVSDWGSLKQQKK